MGSEMCIRDRYKSIAKVKSELLGFPVRMGDLGLTDPVVTSSSKYEASINVTNPLVRRIVEHEHQPQKH